MLTTVKFMSPFQFPKQRQLLTTFRDVSPSRQRVKVVELQPPSSQPGEDARHLVRRKTASYERRGRQRPRAIIDSYNGGQCT